jgi:hypothetical protein
LHLKCHQLGPLVDARYGVRVRPCYGRLKIP